VGQGFSPAELLWGKASALLTRASPSMEPFP
jgi:hypothetical protein